MNDNEKKVFTYSFNFREMKKGNFGMALGMVGKKLKTSLGASVDLGLTGNDGVVHPSLTVWHLKDALSELWKYFFCYVNVHASSVSRTVQRSWNRTSIFLAQLWRACCTDMER